MGPEASLADARRLGALFWRMRRHPRPIVAAVHGQGLGRRVWPGHGLRSVPGQRGGRVRLPGGPSGLRSGHGHGHPPKEAHGRRGLRAGDSGAADLRLGGAADRLGEPGLPDEEFDGQVEAFVKELAGRPPEAVSLTKGLLYELARPLRGRRGSEGRRGQCGGPADRGMPASEWRRSSRNVGRRGPDVLPWTQEEGRTATWTGRSGSSSSVQLLALLGIGLDSPLMVGIAIAVLLVGILLRFLPGGSGRSEEFEEEEG